MPQNLELNEDFIKNNFSAIIKIHQISKAEALNTMEKVKADKLLKSCEYFTIENEDDEDDCYHSPLCEIYWTDLHYPVDGVPPIPMPLYHPDCECFAVYYGSGNIDISNPETLKLKDKLYNLQQQITELQEGYLDKLSQELIKYYNYIKNKKSELLDSESENLIEKDEQDQAIKNFWQNTKNNIIDILLDMLEEVYELTTSVIKELYGEDYEYPTSEIEFYHKDGKTINERLDRWFNPYK